MTKPNGMSEEDFVQWRRRRWRELKDGADKMKSGPKPSDSTECNTCGSIITILKRMHCGRMSTIRYCPACQGRAGKKWSQENREYVRDKFREYMKKEGPLATARSKYRETYLRKAFGLTLDGFAEMVSAQSNLCAICGLPQIEIKRKGKKTTTDLHVDHDHATGKMRGLLCYHCNTLLGHAKDQISVLESAILYLKKHSVELAALESK